MSVICAKPTVLTDETGRLEGTVSPTGLNKTLSGHSE